MIVKWKNACFETNSVNISSFYSVCIAGSYAPLIATLGKEDVVVDGGANIGTFSILASRYVKKIYAIEPNPDNFRLLRRNIALNGATNILPINAALYSHSGKVHFQGRGTSGRISLTGYEISSGTIHDLTDGDSNVLKLDIEGAEPMVLMTERSFSKYKAIAFELDKNQFRNMLSEGVIDADTPTYEDVVSSLKSQDFEVHYHNNEHNSPWREMARFDIIPVEFKTRFFGTRFLFKQLFNTRPPTDEFSMVFAFRK